MLNELPIDIHIQILNKASTKHEVSHLSRIHLLTLDQGDRCCRASRGNRLTTQIIEHIRILQQYILSTWNVC